MASCFLFLRRVSSSLSCSSQKVGIILNSLLFLTLILAHHSHADATSNYLSYPSIFLNLHSIPFPLCSILQPERSSWAKSLICTIIKKLIVFSFCLLFQIKRAQGLRVVYSSIPIASHSVVSPWQLVAFIHVG